MEISIGNKIELVLLSQIIHNEQNKKVYVSKIFDFVEKNKLQIAMPIYEGKIIPLELNDKYSACFYTKKGLLQCNVLITARYKSGNLFFLEILLLGNPEKVQRRQFYRYNCYLDGDIRIMSDNEFTTGELDNPDIPEGDLDWSKVKILDISGGGAKLAGTVPLEKNEVIKIKFTTVLDVEVFFFSLTARVLACRNFENKSSVYELRIEFMKIEQEDRDKIIRYIFESERIERARKVGLV